MKIGILSDTHDQVARTTEAVSVLAAQGASVLIHCGDLTTPEIVHACGQLPCHYVLGNNDFDEPALRQAIEGTGGVLLGWSGIVELDGKRLGVTHGHIASEFRRLLRASPDYLLFGHTHASLNEFDGRIHQINPGALHRARAWTVALLDLELHTVDFLMIR